MFSQTPGLVADMKQLIMSACVKIVVPSYVLVGVASCSTITCESRGHRPSVPVYSVSTSATASIRRLRRLSSSVSMFCARERERLGWRKRQVRHGLEQGKGRGGRGGPSALTGMSDCLPAAPIAAPATCAVRASPV